MHLQYRTLLLTINCSHHTSAILLRRHFATGSFKQAEQKQVKPILVLLFACNSLTLSSDWTSKCDDKLFFNNLANIIFFCALFTCIVRSLSIYFRHKSQFLEQNSWRSTCYTFIPVYCASREATSIAKNSAPAEITYLNTINYSNTVNRFVTHYIVIIIS